MKNKAEKLQKIIADSGLCSRRSAEKLIAEGRVKVNSKLAVLGMRAKKDDKITVNGKKLQEREKDILIALNKPKGYVCTHKKSEKEKNIFELVNIKERLFCIGRLDKSSRGLVFLTNNGDLAHKLSHPSFYQEKEYEVKISKNLTSGKIEKLKEGVDIGEKYPAKMKKVKKIGEKKYRIILEEGKNRQIRRMMERVFCSVVDLKRVRIKNYKMEKEIKPGEWKFLNIKDL